MSRESADRTERIVVVHAHPDDESIVSGGLLARLVRDGVAVTLVTATRGERGEVIPADLAHLEGDERLADVRDGELRAAMAVLGVTDLRYLGGGGARVPSRPARRYRDSGMQWGVDGHPVPLEPLDPESFCAASVDEAAADLTAVLEEVGATAVVTYDDFGGYGHPDHIRVHDVAVRAASSCGVRLYTIVSDDSESYDDLVVELGDDLALKRDAIAAHRTQTVVEGDAFRLSSGPFRPVGAVERFRPFDEADARAAAFAASAPFGSPARATTPPASTPPPTVASRITSIVIAFVAGALIGAITTIAHRSSISVAGTDVPIGLILAGLAVGGVLVGLRTVLEDRLIALAAGIGILLMVGLFSLPSTGGSILVVGDWKGTAWTVLPTIIAVVVLAWPRLPKRQDRARARVTTPGSSSTPDSEPSRDTMGSPLPEGTAKP